MHNSVMEWVKSLPLNWGGTTLECGSLNVNGSVREYFTGPYMGIDLIDGKGVDHLCTPFELTGITLARFDTVISTEMLEHDKLPWESVAAMAALLKTGGDLVITTRGFDSAGCFGYHPFPEDLWRFTLAGMRYMLSDLNCLGDIDIVPDPEYTGVFAHAIKL